MNLEQRIDAFVNLGKFLNRFKFSEEKKTANSNLDKRFFDAFSIQIERAQETNSWFTKKNVLFALESWSLTLTTENLQKWVNSYHFTSENKPKTIAIIMAGNIPLVGFHDFLSVLITGNKALVKLSSNDKYFIPLIAKFLEGENADFKEFIEFKDKKLKNFDAVIATGSNNTARYFDYYFGKYPSIIRKNKNSVAILTGNETNEELEALGVDIFQYFGLGCRSVSKLFVPKNYNFNLLFKALYKFNGIIDCKKYKNNYDYNKAVYLMSLFKLLENGFLMLKEDESYASPIATLFYEHYESYEQLLKKINTDKKYIQCVVFNKNERGFVQFGQSQQPNLWDYADGIDTVDFLLKL